MGAVTTTAARGRIVPLRARLLVLAALVAAPGVWAFVAPASFYRVVATYPPYNEHLFHDVGAFIVGLGAALAAAARWRDGLTVALVGNAVAAVLHAVGHFIDRDLGGRASDPWLLALVAVAFVWPVAKRLSRRPS